MVLSYIGGNMIQITDTKRQNKEALKYILNIYDLRKQYAEQMESVSILGAANNDGMPHGSGVGDPCANKAFSLIEIERKKRWIMSIEMAEQTLSEKTRKFLEYRRDAESQIQRETHKEGGRPSCWKTSLEPANRRANSPLDSSPCSQ